MKKLIVFILCLFASVSWAADVKITELDAYTTAIQTDPLVIVDVTNDITKKITAMNLVGKVIVTSKSAAYTMGSDSGQNMEIYGGIVVLTDAATVTLPAASIGMSGCVYADTANKVSVKAGTNDQFVMTTGTHLDNADKISQTGTQGYVCFVCLAANHWYIWGYRGTWADDGA